MSTTPLNIHLAAARSAELIQSATTRRLVKR